MSQPTRPTARPRRPAAPPWPTAPRSARIAPIPVEWDEIKDQLTRLATELGPDSGISETSLGRFINSTADEQVAEIACARPSPNCPMSSRVLGEGSGRHRRGDQEPAGLRDRATLDSNAQIVQFQDRLADVTGVVDGSRDDLTRRSPSCRRWRRQGAEFHRRVAGPDR